LTTEYELFDVALRRWFESLKTTLVTTAFAANKATTISTPNQNNSNSGKKTIALKILLSSFFLIAIIVAAVAVYIMLIVRKVIRSSPSWSLRFLSKRLRNRSSSTTRANFANSRSKLK